MMTISARRLVAASVAMTKVKTPRGVEHDGRARNLVGTGAN